MEHLKNLIRTIPDFPKPGIMFRDLTTLFLHPAGFKESVIAMAHEFRDAKVDMVVGIESRGFIVAAPIALELGVGFVPMRKAGKLPGEKLGVEYTLEYGTDRLEVHSNALRKGMRVLVVDDLIATGGTMRAACDLVQQTGAEVAGVACLVELIDLKGRELLQDYSCFHLIEFAGE